MRACTARQPARTRARPAPGRPGRRRARPAAPTRPRSRPRTRRRAWPGRCSPSARSTTRRALDDRRRLRLRPHRLPPRPGPAAPLRLEGLRPGAVVARAQPGLPARAGRAAPGRRRDRRDRRGGALPRLPRRLRPGGRRPRSAWTDPVPAAGGLAGCAPGCGLRGRRLRALRAADRAVRGGGGAGLVRGHRPDRARAAVLRADRRRDQPRGVAGQPAAPGGRAGGRGEPRGAGRRPADLRDRQRRLADRAGRRAGHGRRGVRRRRHAAGRARPGRRRCWWPPCCHRVRPAASTAASTR